MAHALMLQINGQPHINVEIEARAFAEWNPIAFACAPLPNVQDVRLVVGSDDLGAPQTSPFDPTWRWVWQPRGVAGIVAGSLHVVADNSTQTLGFSLHLRPRLLDQQTWQLLLDDVTRLGRNLAVALGGTAFVHATLVPLASTTTPLEEAFALLKRHVGTLEQIAHSIVRQPTTELHTQPRRSVFGSIQPHIIQPTSALLADIEPIEQPNTPALRHLHDQLGGAPHTIVANQARASFDTPEHRWLVGLIALIEQRVRRVRRLVEEEQHRQSRPQLEQLAAAIEQALQRLRTLRNHPLLHDIPARRTPPQSQRLVRDHRYRRLLRWWRELRQIPLVTLEASALALPIHDLPTLYEQWCALVVADQLTTLGNVISQTLLAEDEPRERWTLSLNTTTPLLEIQRGNTVFRLRYQPRYTQQPDQQGLTSLDGYVRIPDLVLEKINGETSELLVLDAKYRRANDGRVPQDALDDAYAYRGSIGRDGISHVAHAAIIYPADTAAADYGTVSTIPALPQHLTELQASLQHFLGTMGE